MSAELPQAPQVSPDGKFYWDGERWVPMPAATDLAPVAQPTQGAAEAALQTEVNRYVKQGFRVVSQTGRSAQLVKPKKFSFWWALAWFLLLGVGLIVYIIYYAGKKDTHVYLTVSETGQVTRS